MPPSVPILSDHVLRILTVAGQLLVFGGFIFYAGATFQRLNHLETQQGQHESIDYHGKVGERIIRLETELASLTFQLARLIDQLDRRERNKQGKNDG